MSQRPSDNGPPRIAVFGPHPLLTVTLETEGGERERVHLHAGGQGVWVSRMSACLGTEPVLCAFAGGECGAVLRPLLARVAQCRLVDTVAESGCYVTDRRSGERNVLAMALSDPPSRHEVDELFSRTCAEAINCGWLVVTNPLPAEALPEQLYGDLVADARAGGARVLVDLSSPRLDSALVGEPDLVKLNDWELAEFVRGPVDTPELLRGAAERLRERGARRVIVTRAERPALMLDDAGAWAIIPPRLPRGHREGCGDAMMGALAARWAQGQTVHAAAASGAAAGAATFLRHGLGSASRAVVEQLTRSVEILPLSEAVAQTLTTVG